VAPASQGTFDPGKTPASDTDRWSHFVDLWEGWALPLSPCHSPFTGNRNQECIEALEDDTKAVGSSVGTLGIPSPPGNGE